MEKKLAFKINQNQSGTLFTIKKIQEKGLHPQYQFHIRFNGIDKWYNKKDTIDIDLYLSESEVERLFKELGK